MAGGGGIQHPRGRQLSCRLEQPRYDQGQRQIAAALRRAARQHPVLFTNSVKSARLVRACHHRVDVLSGAKRIPLPCWMNFSTQRGRILRASRLYTRGGVSEVAAAWTKALELAESLDDTEYQKRSLWGLWSFHVNGVEYRAALSADFEDRLSRSHLHGVQESAHHAHIG
jgi:hypothetical protein